MCVLVRWMNARKWERHIHYSYRLFFSFLLSITEYEPDCSLRCVDQVFTYMCNQNWKACIFRFQRHTNSAPSDSQQSDSSSVICYMLSFSNSHQLLRHSPATGRPSCFDHQIHTSLAPTTDSLQPVFGFLVPGTDYGPHMYVAV